MPTIDLSIPPPPSSGLLEALPRRVTLSLPELRLVAERAGGAPLPFDPAAGPTQEAPEPPGHDAESTLARRGLLDPEGAADDLVGAVGLLATPTTALDVDVAVAGIRARSWHRHAGDAVATLSTVDGTVFELAWFPATLWAAELGRVPVLPADLDVRASAVPAHVEVPFELADAAAEAVRTGRGDLLPILADRHPGGVLDDGGPLEGPAVTALLEDLSREAQGRLRVLVAHVAGSEPTVVGVVSWTLLADGWHALRPRHVGGVERVVVRAVEPSDLATELAPVLAEVIR